MTSANSKITAIRPRDRQTVLRAAAYCRVSTAHQNTSFDNQKEHYLKLIRSHREWIFAGIYTDPGLSGTHMASRPGLQRLLADALAGKIDLVLTKSISRFARNTTECLNAIRMLTASGVHLYFEKENIYTGNMDSELLLTLHSTFAREESRIISGNVKWSVRKRFEKGSYKYSRAPYGYRLRNGTFEKDSSTEENVRFIFAALLKGKSTAAIAEELNRTGIPTGTLSRSGEPGVWTASRIRSIVRNPAYIGDTLMQKTYSDDQFFRKINHGEKDQYYMDGHHDALVDEMSFQLANETLRQRAHEKGNHSRYDDPNALNTPRMFSPFSKKLFCGECGAALKRITQSSPVSKRYYWGCTRHLKDRTQCSMKRIPERSVENTFVTMLNKLQFAYDRFFPCLIDKLRTENRVCDPDAAGFQAILDENQKKRMELVRQAQKGTIDIAKYQVETLELGYIDDVALRALEKTDKGSHQIAEANILRNVVSEWRYTADACADFPGAIFSQVCSHVIVCKDSLHFHLKCGCVLEETISGFSS